jgi:antitoxin component YwqK of YwqJK toxin-antitoxin module
MKVFLFFSLIVIPFVVTAQDDGFTNKAEARNQIVNGLKEGKWVEYTDSLSKPTTDTSAPIYSLTVYKADIPDGIVRIYNRGGQIKFKRRYKNGLLNGVLEGYYPNGTLLVSTAYTDGKINGVEKWFYSNGKLRHEIPMTNDVKNGLEKEYYQNGRLKSETLFINGKEGATKKYDGLSKETK